MVSFKSIYQHGLGTGCRVRRESPINAIVLQVPQKNSEGYVDAKHSKYAGKPVRRGF
jgi:hypothetical protein